MTKNVIVATQRLQAPIALEDTARELSTRLDFAACLAAHYCTVYCTVPDLVPQSTVMRGFTAILVPFTGQFPMVYRVLNRTIFSISLYPEGYVDLTLLSYPVQVLPHEVPLCL